MSPIRVTYVIDTNLNYTNLCDAVLLILRFSTAQIRPTHPPTPTP